MRRTLFALVLLLLFSMVVPAEAKPLAEPIGRVVRFATFNASLNRGATGQLITALETGTDPQIRAVAEIIQRTSPDVLLINEFDFVSGNQAAQLFQQNYLGISQNSAPPLNYPYVFIAPSNTGIASGFDLNNNGAVVTTPGAPGYGDDALGFGAFPGQFGMALFSKFPIDTAGIRTFQTFLWKDMPGALLPDDPATLEPADWYNTEELAVFRLSSKSHWDVPIMVGKQTIHTLVSHPTPPVFDGAEDRNGRRNFDEIRFWADYLHAGKRSAYIYDDTGKYGGLPSNARFVIMGDQNSDPLDGDSIPGAIQQLLEHPRVNTRVTPHSAGAVEQSTLQGRENLTHRSDPQYDTADFADSAPGNLRVDYVLPSKRLKIATAGVFWPLAADPLFPLVGVFTPGVPGGFPSSDHRLVWVDLDLRAGLQVNAPTLEGRAVLPALTFADGPPSGSLLGTNPINGVSVPFASQPVQGVSGVLDAGDGNYWILEDNGYGAKNNSADFLLRMYRVRPEFETARGGSGAVALGEYIQLRDPDKRVPFPIVQEGTTERLLTGADFDIESVRQDRHGDFWFGDEFGPFLLHTDSTGKLLEAPIPLPGVFSPDNPTLGSAIANLPRSRGFEGMAISPNGRTLYPILEGALTTDPDQQRRQISMFDLRKGRYTGTTYQYRVEAAANAIGDFTALDEHRFFVIERDNNQGAAAAFKRIFVVDLRDVDANGFLTKHDLIDLLNVRDLDAISLPGRPGDFGIGDPFRFPFVTIESVLPLDRNRLLVINDNNFPFSTGRNPNRPDDTEFIIIRLPATDDDDTSED